ncbi:hypothetical protein GGR07_001453 [Bacteroides pyogenes]|nr:hypothetical protein [Bacteroides pyogenes]SUV32032.1 Uncharacterised protein [Bacteroides pyogenes]
MAMHILPEFAISIRREILPSLQQVFMPHRQRMKNCNYRYSLPMRKCTSANVTFLNHTQGRMIEAATALATSERRRTTL